MIGSCIGAGNSTPDYPGKHTSKTSHVDASFCMNNGITRGLQRIISDMSPIAVMLFYGKRQRIRVSGVSTCPYFMFHGKSASSASSVSAAVILPITHFM